MTREEAIAYWKQRSEHIHNWLEENEDVDFIGEYVEAIDMAIEALKAEPSTDNINCVKCKYYTETEDADGVHGNCVIWNRYKAEYEIERETLDAYHMAIEALQTLEAVERIKTEVLPQTEVYEDYEHATLVDIKEPLVKHDREWLIGCIKHDGFIKTDRFDEANQIILDALQFAEHFDLLKEHEPLQEVVRCKDCRHGEERKTANYLPFTYCTRQKCSVKADDYCSYGERAEQTEYQLPGHDEVMEALNKLTLRGDKDE